MNMDMRTFKVACALAKKRGEHIFIGGGEPTVHPEFWAMIGWALGNGDEYVGLVTNGKRTGHALRLANLAKRGVLSVDLSRDEFHEEIAPEVVKAFIRDPLGDNDLRSIRTIHQVQRVGFADKNGVWTEEGRCCCEDLFVKPDGRIFGCGCEHRQFGTVFAPEIPDNHEYGACYTAEQNVEAQSALT
jgi:hypothetical protein